MISKCLILTFLVHLHQIIDSDVRLIPPRSSWEAGFSPEMTPRFMDALNSMRWIFFVSRSEPVFLTSDNPVFIPNMGLEKRKSEFSFPISSKVVLWGSWRTDLTEGYLEANRDTIAQFNRRTGAMFFPTSVRRF